MAEHRDATIRLGALLLMTVLLAVASQTPAAAGQLVVAPFSAMPAGDRFPEGWEPLIFDGVDRHTRYWLAPMDGQLVLRAESEAAASGLQRRIDVDIARWPQLQWRWQVVTPVAGEDLAHKTGDDLAARLYVYFAFEPERAGFWERQLHALGRRRYGYPPPGSALIYVWSGKAQRGTAVPSPYTDKAMVLVLRGRSDRAGQWFSERRDVAADYRRLFQRTPPPVVGVALMCDTDNTGGRAAAAFGDIVFREGSGEEGAPAPQE